MVQVMPDRLADSHFVSRFLTKPWEDDNRKLWFYDFAAHRFGRQSSKSLLAVTEGYPHEVEDALNRLVESPVSSVLGVMSPDRLQLLSAPQSWSVYRALLSLTLLQASRYGELHGDESQEDDPDLHLDDDRDSLPSILARGHEHLDDLAQAHSQVGALYLVPVKPPAFLFYPDVGFFGVPTPGAFATPLALPLSPQLAAVTVARRLPEDVAQGTLGDANRMMQLSVGLDTSRRIILPQMGSLPAEDELGPLVEALRRKNIEWCTAVHSGNARRFGLE